jgi:hypothetical protein
MKPSQVNKGMRRYSRGSEMLPFSRAAGRVLFANGKFVGNAQEPRSDEIVRSSLCYGDRVDRVGISRRAGI